MSIFIAVLDALSNVAGLVVVLGAAGFCAAILPSAWGRDG